ncbi:hypothetical protein FGO68_gene7527 [Halteria grandinella]|uniref:Uncharacterized protein n=1 Tax=Halteria grandinella TaxID=5974 RepID=A0A8J8NSQ5_HALGN|nr:hypothetical protein FGO68_gene7527 [Halteria grandinella]
MQYQRPTVFECLRVQVLESGSVKQQQLTHREVTFYCLGNRYIQFVGEFRSEGKSRRPFWEDHLIRIQGGA